MTLAPHGKATTSAFSQEKPALVLEHPVPPVTPAPYFRYKVTLGRILGSILLVPSLPIIAALVVLVRLTSRGPGIYRQVRVGRHGKTFNMYKIRTMREDAEVGSGPTWTVRDDPRITRVGRVLRKFHLDEFPQLFNVLKGEMTLIGPRPERPEFTQVLAREVPGYLDRLTVHPGITGLAQINLPPDTDIESVRRKLVLDLEYVRHATVMLDLRMFLGTLLRLFGFGGERVMSWMRLRREVPSSKQLATDSGESPAAYEIPREAQRCTPAAIRAQSRGQGGAEVNVPEASNGSAAVNGNNGHLHGLASINGKSVTPPKFSRLREDHSEV